jgi:AcrR family transcriptional regulator
MEDVILHRKEKLIITTIEVIEEVGIQSLSTRLIAKKEGVSEATLFRHYKSKNDLLLAVLENFSQFDQDIIQSVRLKKLLPFEAIKYLITMLVEYCENYPAITSIGQLFDVFRYEPDLAQKTMEIQNIRKNFLVELIISAQDNGDIDPNTEEDAIANLIIGTFKEIIFQWRSQNYEFSIKEKVHSAVNLILNSLLIR